MTKNTTKTAAVAAGTMLFDDWFDPIEDAVRETARGVIETIMEEELDATLSRPRYGRRKPVHLWRRPAIRQPDDAGLCGGIGTIG